MDRKTTFQRHQPTSPDPQKPLPTFLTKVRSRSHVFCIKTLPLKTPLRSGGRYSAWKRLRIQCGKTRTCAAEQNRCYTTLFPTTSHNIVFCPLSGTPSAPHAPGFDSEEVAAHCILTPGPKEFLLSACGIRLQSSGLSRHSSLL